MMGHLAVASLAGEEAWRLSPGEADAYTNALTEFLRWHAPSFSATGKRGSEIALIVTMGMIYLPKAAYVFAKSRGMVGGGAPAMGHNGGPPMPASEPAETIQ